LAVPVVLERSRSADRSSPHRVLASVARAAQEERADGEAAVEVAPVSPAASPVRGRRAGMENMVAAEDRAVTDTSGSLGKSLCQ
jgi:hypothetical protein